MKTINAFGAFGAVVLENVDYSVDSSRKAAITDCEVKQKAYNTPRGSFLSFTEMYYTAELRGHKIKSFVASCDVGVGFYTI